MNAQLKEQPWVSNGPTKVYQAIAAITGELAKVGIAKGRKNSQQGYAFRGIDDVYSALSGLLASHKLCVIPRVISRSVTEVIPIPHESPLCPGSSHLSKRRLTPLVS